VSSVPYRPSKAKILERMISSRNKADHCLIGAQNREGGVGSRRVERVGRTRARDGDTKGCDVQKRAETCWIKGGQCCRWEEV
jgi:hypothetical protein